MPYILSKIHIHTSICHMYSHIYTYINLIWCISCHGHEPWKYPYNIYAGDSHGSWAWETHNIHFIICKSPVCVYMRVYMAYIAMRVSCLHIMFHTYYIMYKYFLTDTHTRMTIHAMHMRVSCLHIIFHTYCIMYKYSHSGCMGAWGGGWVRGGYVCLCVCRYV